MFPKELMLIKQADQKSVIFVVFLNKGFKFKPYISNRSHVLIMMSMNLSDIAILKIKNIDYCCIITGISKNEAIQLLQSIDLTEKNGTL